MNDYLAVRRGDLSKLAVLSESFIFSHPLGNIHGPDELVSMQEELKEAFPDEELTVENMLVGDDIAMWEWTLSGTHEGEWQDFPPTSRRFSITGMSKTVMKDGKIAENWAYYNASDFIAQLEGTE